MTRRRLSTEVVARYHRLPTPGVLVTLERMVPAAPESEKLPRLSPEHLARHRERVAQALCAHFACDHLSENDLEERLSWTYRLTSSSRLQQLVDDLPALPADLNPGSVP